jgi:DNA-binding response OmpR family regulator
VAVAGDELRGVQKALAGTPEVAVVDLGLPLLDDLEVARRVRAALGEDIFLIALTGGDPEGREAALLAGFDAYLLKPADQGELAAPGGRGPAGCQTAAGRVGGGPAARMPN